MLLLLTYELKNVRFEMADGLWRATILLIHSIGFLIDLAHIIIPQINIKRIAAHHELGTVVTEVQIGVPRREIRSLMHHFELLKLHACHCVRQILQANVLE